MCAGRRGHKVGTPANHASHPDTRTRSKTARPRRHHGLGACGKGLSESDEHGTEPVTIGLGRRCTWSGKAQLIERVSTPTGGSDRASQQGGLPPPSDKAATEKWGPTTATYLVHVQPGRVTDELEWLVDLISEDHTAGSTVKCRAVRVHWMSNFDE